MTAARTAALAAALAAAAGCGDGSGRHAYTGRVTFAGQPVPAGTLAFEPDTGRGNRGPGGVAEIRDGRYATHPELGPVGGPHLVRVTGYDGRPAGESALGKPLFPECVIAIDLPRANAALDIEVPPPARR